MTPDEVQAFYRERSVSLRAQITDILAENPGLRTVDLAERLPWSSRDNIKVIIIMMFRRGLLRRTKHRYVGPRGGRPWYFRYYVTDAGIGRVAFWRRVAEFGPSDTDDG